MITSISGKILEVFRNLKSDAVPKPPRPDEQDSSNDVTDIPPENNGYVEEDEDETFINVEGYTGTENIKNNKKKFSSSKTKDKSTKSNKKPNTGVNNVCTEASGNVINIVGSKNLHFGNEFIYYLGPTNVPKKQSQNSEEPEEEIIQKDNLIELVMEAKIKLEFEYMEYISKNLGKNWYKFFRSLGYTQGCIETCDMDAVRNGGGVSEARYKLLLDWNRNDDDGTLGKMATKLWQHGERQIVKELSIIYNRNHKLE